MSGAMESRAAVFTSQAQDVEVYAQGAWLPGSMLGWRHDARGGCQVWVRVAGKGAEANLWTDLECLRLPEGHLALAPGPVGGAAVPAAAAGVHERSAADAGEASVLELTATRGMPAVRDVAAARVEHSAGRGRRRADRRVVGDTAEWRAVGEDGLPLPPAGRHRAPSTGSGRHRAADTDVFPAVRAAPDADGRAPVTSDVLPGRSPSPSATAAEPDLLTRPMRFGAVVPHRRRASRDDTLTGV